MRIVIKANTDRLIDLGQEIIDLTLDPKGSFTILVEDGDGITAGPAVLTIVEDASKPDDYINITIERD